VGLILNLAENHVIEVMNDIPTRLGKIGPQLTEVQKFIFSLIKSIFLVRIVILWNVKIKID